VPRSTVVLYRSVEATTLLTTLASASARGGPLHAHGPALHGSAGAEAAATIEAVATSHGSHPLVWDGDAPADAAGVDLLVEEVDAGLLVCEWSAAEPGAELALRLLAAPPCDVLVVRPGAFTSIEGIVVGAGEGPNAPLVAELARHWGALFDVPVSFIRVAADSRDAGRAAAMATDLAAGLPVATPVNRDVVSVLSDVAAGSGFLALGAAEGVPLDQTRIQTLAMRVAASSAATLVIGRRGAPRS
jgi:hypothetical protein